jgi:hypothetical protein
MWAKAVLRGNGRKGLVLPRQAATLSFRLDRSPAVRQSRGEGTALSGGSEVVTQDAPEAFPTLPFADETPELGARVDTPSSGRRSWPVYGGRPRARCWSLTIRADKGAGLLHQTGTSVAQYQSPYQGRVFGRGVVLIHGSMNHG